MYIKPLDSLTSVERIRISNARHFQSGLFLCWQRSSSPVGSALAYFVTDLYPEAQLGNEINPSVSFKVMNCKELKGITVQLLTGEIIN